MNVDGLESDNPLDAAPVETDEGADVQDDNPDNPESKEKEAPSSKEDKAKKKEPFLMNFPDAEAAEKSFKEEQAKITKVSMENAALKAKLEVLERMNEPNYENITSENQKKRDEEIIVRLEEGGSKAVLDTIREGLMDVVDLNKKEIAALKSELQKAIEEHDPDFTQNKEEIENLKQEYSLSTDNARKLLKNMQDANKLNEPPQKRAGIPGRMSVTHLDSDTAPRVLRLSPEMEAYISDSGLDEESQKRIRNSVTKSLVNKGT